MRNPLAVTLVAIGLIAFAVITQWLAMVAFPDMPGALRALIAGAVVGAPIGVIVVNSGLFLRKTA
ncbi:hypothetical protein [Oceanicaulis sp. MMSF_3324]|uniref:hypothetical protein n=1 Tax=Oceanicaulis sp. MMSF_3324 TaxID=3046702 RepID=UPI00273D062A|nr:hypothetical protein [Oceanicaulis sp. MMSF_3324]